MNKEKAKRKIYKKLIKLALVVKKYYPSTTHFNAYFYMDNLQRKDRKLEITYEKEEH